MIEIYRHIIKNPTKVFVEFDKPVPKIYRKEKQAQDKAKKFLKEDRVGVSVRQVFVLSLLKI